jgi:hypothetical protein
MTENWAGYVATGINVTAVSGSWAVPWDGITPPGAAGTWVGIGGWSERDLIQAGTQEIGYPYDLLLPGGEFAAWYELLPARPVVVGGPVHPGDVMHASIVKRGTHRWTIEIDDATAGWIYAKTVSYDALGSSAEWIHEAPTFVAGPVPMSGLVTVSFDGANTATIAGVTGNLRSLYAFPVEALPLETTTSDLDYDGDGFNICTYALACGPPRS